MNDNRVTDTRPRIIVIEEAVVDECDLPPLAGWLYVVIVRHINRKNNDAFPSVTTLAKMANMSRASVLRYTKLLEEKNLIEVVREKDEDGENQVNHYRLLSAKYVVSHSNHLVPEIDHGGITQQPPVVSQSNHNHTEPNHTNLTREKDNARAREGEPLTPEQVSEAKRIMAAAVAKVSRPEPRAFTDEEIQAQVAIIQAKYGNRQAQAEVRT